MRASARFFVLLAGLVLVAGSAAAENVVRIGQRGDALTLDPYAQAEGPTFTLLSQMYEPLINFDADLQLEGILATSWEAVEPTRWRIELREGVSFHDGTPFTSADIVFSITRAQQTHSDYSPFVDHITEVIAVDDHTVDMITDVPLPLLPQDLTNILIVSEAWMVEHNAVAVQNFSAGDENYAVRHTNGTGPFELEIREQDIRTVMTRNEDWWGLAEEGAHNVDRAIFLAISNDSTRIAALLSGEIDVVTEPPLQDLRRIERTGGFKLEEVAQVRTVFLGMDQASAELRSSNIEGANPLADVRVRRAMYQALNMDAIQSRIMRDRSEPAGMLIAPGINGYNEAQDVRFDFDLEAARALMADAGYADGFSIRLDCPNNRYVNDEAVCQAVVGMLAQIEVDVSLEAIPKTLHFPKLERRETDFYMLGWGPGTMDSQDVFTYLYATGGLWNVGEYSNPEMDALIEAGTSEFDVALRSEILHQVWDIAVEDVVYLPLHHQVLVWAMRDHISTTISPNNNFQLRWVHMDEQ